jgi:uncharacterized membrane protein YdbT with pleckstrin-like domain
MESIQNFRQAQENYQSIKPKIVTILLLLKAIGLATLVLIGAFLSLIDTLFDSEGSRVPLIVILIIYIIIVLISYFVQRATLNRTEYKFYSDRVEYYEGFLVKNRKTITYEKISNIGQRKGIIEGLFGLGTIFVDTPGSSAKGHELSISYLENPDQTYDWITKVISNKK